MKYLIGLLCLFSVAQAQFAPTSAKSKFVNGIGIGSKDTSQFTAADTIALTIARDSVMYYRYRGFWRPIATGGNLSAYKLISDTLFANGYTTRARLKQGLDSLAATKVNISDTASMLAPYFRDSDTTGLLNQVVRTFGAQTVFGIKAFGDSMRIGAGLSVLRIQADAGISLSQELNIRKNTNSLSTDFLKIGTSVGSGILYGSYIKSTSNHLSFTGNDMVLGVTNTSGNNVDAISISSAGVTSINSLSTAGIVTNTSAGVLGTTSIVPIANGGTGSSTQNFVDLTTSQTITGQKTFNVSGNSGNVIINHGSGSGVALNITKGGNGEGLIVNKTSGSGNAATITGTLEATTLVKNGGTSSQFLKADGSVDNNTYTTTSQNALKLNISDTAAMLLGYTRVQRFTDSLTNVQSRIQTKQNILTLTTTGTSGAATLTGATLNIPQYQAALTNPVTGTGTTNYLPKFTGSTTVGNSQVFDNGTSVGIGTTDFDIFSRFDDSYLTFSKTGNIALNINAGAGSGRGAQIYMGQGGTRQLTISSNASESRVGTTTNTSLIFTTNDAARLTLTNTGNLGLGVTPSAWSSTVKALEIGSGGQFIGAYGGTDLWSGTNMYYEGTTFKYKESSRNVTLYSQSLGAHVWLTAPSGTAGNAITFTQAMTLDANGRLGIGTTSPSQRLEVSGGAIIASGFGNRASGTGKALEIGMDGTQSILQSLDRTAGVKIPLYIDASATYIMGGNVGIGTTSPANRLTVAGSSGTIMSLSNGVDADLLMNFTSGVTLLTPTTGILAFGTSSTERMRITSGGNLLVGTTTDNGARLQVAGDGTFSGNVAINGTVIGTDQTFGNPYRTFAFGTNSNSFNRIFAANDASDGMYLNAATGQGINFRVNGGGANVFTIASTGAATFSSLAGTGDRLVQANSLGELSATQTIASGTYTPTITDNLNTSSYTVQHASYTRIGNICTVYMRVSFTASSSVCGINVTIPVGNNFSNSNQATGSNGNGANGLVMYNSTASASTNQIFTSMSGATVGSNTISFSFQYQVQ
jgi:hypothetical protein